MPKLSALAKFVIGIVAVSVIGFALILFKEDSITWNNPTKIHIAASFYPLGEFAENVGGDRVEVKVVTPPGVESHDYEPSVNDIKVATNSDLFVYNGVGFDPWAERIAGSVEKRVVNASKYVQLRDEDPHFWLDPIQAIEIIKGIAENLADLDPEGRDIYFSNAGKYTDELRELDREFRDGLSSCEGDTIVVSHNAFSYLTGSYGISQIVLSGISPEEEPSPRYLTEATELARQKNIKYIFFESLVSPKLSEAIANEIGATTLVLNPIEGLSNEDIDNGEDYITIMKANLSNLRKALQCN